MKLKDIIKKHRKVAGLTQKACAQLAGIGKTTLFDIEHGKKSVGWDSILKVLKLLNIQLYYTSGLQKEYEEIN